MFDRNEQRFSKPLLWLLRAVGVIVPRRLRADWRQEWEVEFGLAPSCVAESSQFPEDTTVEGIVIDCLSYAEIKKLDAMKELASLRKPILSGWQKDSSAGWTMKMGKIGIGERE